MILQSVTHYIGNDSLPADQKAGFIVLNKLVSLWVTSHPSTIAITPLNATPAVSPVPGFEQFLYSEAVKLCFEIPLRRDFDFNDAQSSQVCHRRFFLFVLLV